MTKEHKPDAAIVSAIQDAVEQASQAAADHISKNPGVWYPCGFSWVKIKPARGKLVTELKELGLGRPDTYDGGFVVYNPSGNSTQWMDAKAEGSKAFAAALGAKFPQYKFLVETRLD